MATGSVNPRGNDTQVVFDYGPTAAYGAVSAPVGVANGADPVPVTGVLAGLAPSTTYHVRVRVRATNAEGSMAGADATFTTPAGIVDADHDGVSPPRDCRDDNPAIRPGAVDKPGDKIDQDCSGSDAPYPELTATVVFAWTTGRTTVINRIDISRLRGGERDDPLRGRALPLQDEAVHAAEEGQARVRPLARARSQADPRHDHDGSRHGAADDRHLHVAAGGSQQAAEDRAGVPEAGPDEAVALRSALARV